MSETVVAVSAAIPTLVYLSIWITKIGKCAEGEQPYPGLTTFSLLVPAPLHRCLREIPLQSLM